MEGEQKQKQQQQTELASAKKGLLRAIWSTSVAPRFSSKPIMEDYLLDRSGFYGSGDTSTSSVSAPGRGNSSREERDATTAPERMAPERFQNSIRDSAHLTRSEQAYLEQLLQSDDLDSIRMASTRLVDTELFPAAEEDDHQQHQPQVQVLEKKNEDTNNQEASPLPHSENDSIQKSSTPHSRHHKRRDSLVQQQLFKLHEKAAIMPSTILKRMGGLAAAKASRPLFISRSNSLALDDDEMPPQSDGEGGGDEEEKSSKDSATTREAASGKEDSSKWNPLKDLNTWIDGSEGVEVDDEGTPEISAPTSNPFKILGTSANDTSCHPHVLSPPLMEGLQLFMPESLQEHHYWLKYSLVRDGPGQLKMLRHSRASQHTILAIETTDGHVFGSFTSQPWRSVATEGYYGSKESFVWRMRRSRNEAVRSIVEQILLESQMDVFPFTGRNSMVQHCTKYGIALGHTELLDESIGKGEKDDVDGKECESDSAGASFGLAIKLDQSFMNGTTSSSETFGNPCLVKRESRGEAFEVANIELWTMTPHQTEEEADRAEMRSLFLEEKRHAGSNLNLIEILVGGAHI